MSYRSIYVKEAEKICLRDNNLVVQTNEREVLVPLEDIAIILLEDPKSVVTTRLIASLSSYYIGLIVCDDKYNPVSITLPMSMHYKQLKVFKSQMEVRKTFNSALWEQIIKRKIRNQRIVVELTSKDEYTINRLKELEKEVKSNDKYNVEALAAKVFFQGMYGSYFTRRKSSEDEINSALDYGYTILATNLSRVLTMYGFNTIIGIHHRSMTNNFNLSYDLVEVFRPLVDYYVYKNIDNLVYPLPFDIRSGLIKLLMQPVRMKDKNFFTQFAMEELVVSYIEALEKDDPHLVELPLILETGISEDEFDV